MNSQYVTQPDNRLQQRTTRTETSNRNTHLEILHDLRGDRLVGALCGVNVQLCGRAQAERQVSTAKASSSARTGQGQTARNSKHTHQLLTSGRRGKAQPRSQQAAQAARAHNHRSRIRTLATTEPGSSDATSTRSESTPRNVDVSSTSWFSNMSRSAAHESVNVRS